MNIENQQTFFEAIDIYKSQLGQSNEDYLILFKIGICYKSLGDIETAKDYFKQSINCNSNFHQARLELKLLLINHTFDRKELDNNYKKNIDIIKNRYPDLYTKLAESKPNENYQIFQFIDSTYDITIKDDDGNYSWLNGIYMAKDLYQGLIDAYQQYKCLCLVGVNVGNGLLVMYMLTRDQPLVNYHIPIYVIEPDIYIFKSFLCMYDLSELLLSGRILFFIASDALDEFKIFLEKDIQVYLPDAIVKVGEYIYVDYKNVVTQIVTQRYEELESMFQNDREEVNSYYNDISVKQWCDIFSLSRLRPLRVLGYTSKFTTYLQYSMRDLIKGFQECGCETFYSIESCYIYRHNMFEFIKILNEFKPDLIILIDHFRYEFGGIIHQNIPVVSWIQDVMQHIRDLKDPSSITENDYIFGFTIGVKNGFRQHSAFKNKNIYLLNIPVNTDIYYPIVNCKKKFDVTYISHLPNLDSTLQPIRDGIVPSTITLPNELIFLRKIAETIEYLSLLQLWNLLINPAITRQFAMNICKENSLPFSESLLNHLNYDDVSPFSYEILLQMKIKPIRYLLQHNIEVRVFGNNWEKIHDFERIAMGKVENGYPLNEINNMTKINLNISPGTSFHMRAPEIMGSKAFMLSCLKENDTTPITDYFEEGKEVIVFRDEIDLLEKVKYYLQNDYEREKIAESAYEAVISKFSIKAAANKIIETIRYELST